MRVLVTGGTGFIGSQIVRALLAAGHEVRAVARSGSARDRLSDVERRIDWREADVFGNPPPDWRALGSGIDLCIHAAWYAVPGKYLEAIENLTCVSGSLALLRGLTDAGVKRAAFVGTCFEYDFESGWLHETAPVKPASLYAAAKASTRLLAEPLARAAGMAFTWVRPFYQYGPFEDPRRLVPHVIGTLLRGDPAEVTRGTQVRDFLHVADVGSAIAAVATSNATGIVNIGSGRPVTVRDIVSTIASSLGREDLVRYGARPDNPTDPPFICADNRRLIAETGWSPAYDLRSGLEDTIAWWRVRSGT
ncbi:MAG: NAD-dependent epimerase/dehydratase family protein [Candidatus Eiseniibacteriota bacterium]